MARTGLESEGRQSGVQLYCPYDRKLTRHTRRDDGELACVECGRRVGTAAGSPGDQPSGTTAIPSVRPTVRSREAMPRRPGTPWMLIAGLLVVGLLGVLATAHIVRSLAAPSAGTATAAGAATPSQSATVEPVTVYIANTDGLGAYIRRTPNLEDRMRAWPDGTPLRVVGPDSEAHGMVWKEVEDPEGARGWIPAQYTAIPDQ